MSETGPREETPVISMADLMWNLPLFDNPFLSMQGQNIMLIDFYLRDLESELLRELINRQRTPVVDANFVSALSQMWIFAVYELLRTWRQFINDLKKPKNGPKRDAAQETASQTLAGMSWENHLEQYRRDEIFRQALNLAYAQVELVFRRIEGLRMNLAKHEVPKKPMRAMAPGYGRISESDGSMTWFVDLGHNQVDMLSRREISIQLRRVVIGRSLADDEETDDDAEME